MKKVGVLLLASLLVISIVLAQSNQTNQSGSNQNTNQNQNRNINTDGIDDAYQCLEDLISDRTDSEISLQEAIFSTLALGSDSKLSSVIDREKSSANCWPKSSCTIKETAQVLLAQKRAGKNTADAKKWITSQNGTASELLWYVEIDIQNHVRSSCTVSYQGNNNQITINEDMTISGNAGSCLSISPSGFWLRIRDTCMGETFRVSCDEDFVTSLLYQKSGSSTIFVSPETHSASSLGSTEEKVESLCFKSGNSCDYEGTLWAALALDNLKEDISPYLPYLLAFSEDNKRLFPASILYILTQGTEQYSEVIQAQQQAKYWQAPNTKYNRFYDTSLGMLSLQGSGAQELVNAQSYLLSIQTAEGCWNNNNIRDTAFVLYSGWPSSAGGDDDGGSRPPSCTQLGMNCVGLTACTAAGGVALDHSCISGVCCSKPVQELSCVAQSGTICSASQDCSGVFSPASDSSRCCIGTCVASQDQNECQALGGQCYSSCQGNEEQIDAACSTTGSVCCLPGESDSSSSWTWVFILLVLIVIAVLAIIYRNRLMLALYKLKRRKTPPSAPAGQQVQRRPPFPPYGPQAMRRPMPAQIRPQNLGPPRQVPKAPPREDKELEDTLRKLREMSK